MEPTASGFTLFKKEKGKVVDLLRMMLQPSERFDRRLWIVRSSNCKSNATMLDSLSDYLT